MQQSKAARSASGLSNFQGRVRALQLSAAIALGMASPLAHAIEYEPIRVGAIEVIPDFNTKVTPTGSVLLPNGQEETGELLLFRPRIKAAVVGERQQFSTTMEVQNGVYSAQNTAGYVDWKLENVARFELGGQRSLRLRTENHNTREGAGSVSVFDTRRDAARFATSTFDVDYEQSLWSRRGQLVLGAGTFTKEYLTDKAGNHADSHASASLRWRLLPGADLQMQYRARDIDYAGEPGADNTGSAVDRREVFSYVGASWEPKITGMGKLRLASGYKQTDNGAPQAIADTATWETNLRWQPLEGSLLTLAADHSLRERYGLERQDSTNNYRYNWEQRWAGQLKSTLSGSYSRSVNASTRRENQGLGVKLRLDYAYSTWVNMFVAFGHDRRETAGVRTYSQRNVMFGIAASLDRLFGR